MKKVHYTVYKITNVLNGMIYVGCHKTANLDDGYMGSGKLITRAIKKYGQENFQKEYLYIFDSPDQMFKMESSIVNEEFILREDVYNLTEGGNGSWFASNNDSALKEKRRKAAFCGFVKSALIKNQRMLVDEDYRKKITEKTSTSVKRAISEGRLSTKTFSGKTHTAEYKNRMSEIMKIKQSGEKNSQFGKVWMVSSCGSNEKKVLKEEVDVWLLEGWKKGRKIRSINAAKNIHNLIVGSSPTKQIEKIHGAGAS
jgi:hypothetical protein